MNAFIKTLLAAILLGVAVAAILSFALLHSNSRDLAPLVVVLFFFPALAFTASITTWLLISGLAYGLARYNDASQQTTRQLAVALCTSGFLFFVTSIVVGRELLTNQSLNNRLAQIDRGDLSTPDLKRTVDECISHSGAAILRRDFCLMDHIVRSCHTPPEVLSYIVGQGDIVADFWPMILANPQVTLETKAKIEQRELEAEQKWGGIVTEDRLRERAKHPKSPITPR